MLETSGLDRQGPRPCCTYTEGPLARSSKAGIAKEGSGSQLLLCSSPGLIFPTQLRPLQPTAHPTPCLPEEP
jgi:hypothetical protein